MSDIEPEICNCAALRQAARRVTKLYDDALAPIGVGLNQFSILARLDRVGRARSKSLRGFWSWTARRWGTFCGRSRSAAS